MQLPALKLSVIGRKLLDLPDLPSQAKQDSFTFFRLKGLASCSSIRQKIGFGFALAFGVATLGTTVGHILEGFYNQQTLDHISRASQESAYLATWKTTILQLHLHEHQLASLNLNPEKFEQQYHQLTKEVKKLDHLVAQSQSSLIALNSSDEKLHESKAHQRLKHFIKKYPGTIAIYTHHLQAVLQQIEPNLTTPQEVEKAQQTFKTFINSEVASEFDDISDEVARLADDFSQHEADAVASLKKTAQLSSLIQASTLLVAAVIAAAMAAYISREIARPLESTTAVAQRVTQTSNFHLTAPVTTNDEVGRLATSLNQLIQRVADYTYDLQQAQAQLIQTEKMSSLGQMVAGIAHEVNNPINFIHGNLDHASSYVQDLLDLIQLYQRQYPHPTGPIQEHIEDIDLEFLTEDLPKTLSSMHLGTDRIRQLVISLRNFSRHDEAELKKVDLHEGIDSTLLILNNRLKNKIEVIKHYGNLPSAECYPAQINQVFMNILSNAIDELLREPDQHKKQIEIRTDYLKPNHVQVRIKDNGSGMPPEIQNKIFDPFFTTKPVGKGTGLGLSISYQIVEKHQGAIQVNSQLSEGTEFVITLPLKQVSNVVKTAG